MAKGRYLGEFEHLVLLALLRLKNSAYGVTIRREIGRRTGRSAAIGAVYACLERLERKGFVSVELSEPRPEPGGRARKYFHLTPPGAQALSESRRMLGSMAEGLDVDAELEVI